VLAGPGWRACFQDLRERIRAGRAPQTVTIYLAGASGVGYHKDGVVIHGEKTPRGASGKLNVSRGLHRLFVVFTICWCSLALVVLWPDWKAAIGIPISAVPGYEVSRSWPRPRSRVHAFQTLDGEHLCYDESDARHSKWPLGIRCYPAMVNSFVPDALLPDAPPPKPIARTLLFAACPPLIYTLGLIAAWVLRGFSGPEITEKLQR